MTDRELARGISTTLGLDIWRKTSPGLAGGRRGREGVCPAGTLPGSPPPPSPTHQLGDKHIFFLMRQPFQQNI